MNPRGLALAALALVAGGCLAAPLELDPGSAARVSALVAALEPKVRRALGADDPARFTFEVRRLPGNRAQTVDGRQVLLDPSALDEHLDRTIAHELVHVYAAAPSSRWGELPRGVEEGLCYWVAALVTGEASTYEGPEPSREELLEALSVTDREYLALAEDRRARVNQAGAWLASRLLPELGP